MKKASEVLGIVGILATFSGFITAGISCDYKHRDLGPVGVVTMLAGGLSWIAATETDGNENELKKEHQRTSRDSLSVESHTRNVQPNRTSSDNYDLKDFVAEAKEQERQKHLPRMC